MREYNNPHELTIGDEQINRMDYAINKCFIKQRPELRKLEELKSLPFYQYCDECCFEHKCKLNYDHYCTLSVTKEPLDIKDFEEFRINFDNLRMQPDMFGYSFQWKAEVQEEDEV